LGIGGYYNKPIDKSKMLAQIRAMLESLWWTTTWQRFPHLTPR